MQNQEFIEHTSWLWPLSFCPCLARGILALAGCLLRDVSKEEVTSADKAQGWRVWERLKWDNITQGKAHFRESQSGFPVIYIGLERDIISTIGYEILCL